MSNPIVTPFQLKTDELSVILLPKFDISARRSACLLARAPRRSSYGAGVGVGTTGGIGVVPAGGVTLIPEACVLSAVEDATIAVSAV